MLIASASAGVEDERVVEIGSVTLLFNSELSYYIMGDVIVITKVASPDNA